MPTYEFDCPRCGSFERRLPLGAAAEALDCPSCGEPARRVYSAPALASGRKRDPSPPGEPRVVKRTGEEPPAPTPKVGRGRPWQLSH